jgi:aryl-alcohol dehydrogenase-like predicted oxidoreductase
LASAPGALRPFGRTDLKVSALCLGAMNFGDPTGEDESFRIVDAALDAGINFIDVLQLHRPSSIVPQEETLAAFDELVRAGKVRYIGCSTHPAWMVMEALAASERLGLAAYVSEQPPYNLLDRRIENELLPLCRKYGLAVIPWSPIAGGILAGRYRSTDDVPAGSRRERRFPRMNGRITPAALVAVDEVAAVAADLGLTSGQLATLWVKDQPGVTSPIVGPRTMAQLEEFLPVLDLTLDEATGARLDEIVHPGNAVADFHNGSGWMRATVT